MIGFGAEGSGEKYFLFRALVRVNVTAIQLYTSDDNVGAASSSSFYGRGTIDLTATHFLSLIISNSLIDGN